MSASRSRIGRSKSSTLAAIPSPLCKEPEQETQYPPHILAVHNPVHKAVLVLKLARLEVRRKLPAQLLLTHAAAGKPHDGPRLRQNHIAQRGVARENPSRGRAGQHADERHPGIPSLPNRRSRLGHLHQRQKPLLHPCPPGGAEQHDSLLLLSGTLERPSHFLPIHRAHGAAHEPEIRRADDERHLLDGRPTRHNGLGQTRGLPGLRQFLRIFGKTKRIHRYEVAVGLLERPGIHRHLYPFPSTHPVVMPAPRTDLQIALKLPNKNDLVASLAFLRDAVGYAFRRACARPPSEPAAAHCRPKRTTRRRRSLALHGKGAASLKSVTDLRKEIDAIDDQIVELLNRRAELAKEIGQHKARARSHYFTPEREDTVLKRLVHRSRGTMPADALRAVYREIISACRALEKPLTIAFLGPLGTFSHQAAIQKFGSSSVLAACDSIPEIFAQVERGNSDPAGMAATIKEAIQRHLSELDKVSAEKLVRTRYRRFRSMGRWMELTPAETAEAEQPQAAPL